MDWRQLFKLLLDIRLLVSRNGENSITKYGRMVNL